MFVCYNVIINNLFILLPLKGIWAVLTFWQSLAVKTHGPVFA